MSKELDFVDRQFSILYRIPHGPECAIVGSSQAGEVLDAGPDVKVRAYMARLVCARVGTPEDYVIVPQASSVRHEAVA